MKCSLYYLHALSAVHVGTGRGTGLIDLPIARERATSLPFIPGSGIKGVLREELRPNDSTAAPDWETLFGPHARSEQQGGFAGALAVGDAHLLCLPARSLAATFAWATCPFILARYAREAALASLSAPEVPNVAPGAALVTSASEIDQQGTIILEDLDLEAQRAAADAWADHISVCVFAEDDTWRRMFRERFAILSDGVLDFLAETTTEVRARIRLNESTHTVAPGALWYEENLPAETLMFGVLGVDRARRGRASADELLGRVPESLRLQLGGKATVGRGIVQWRRSGH